MGRNTLLFKNLLLSAIFFVCLFYISPHSVFAQEYQLPSDYVEKQWQQYQKNNQALFGQVQAQPISTPSPAPSPQTTYPTPSYANYLNSSTPQTQSDYQQLQLIKQIQSGKTSLFNVYLLKEILGFPLLPVQIKLNLYYFFSSLPFVSSIQLSPLWFSLFILLLPSLTILMTLLFLFTLYFVFRRSSGPIAVILERSGRIEKEEKTLLELTFPSDTTKSAFATEQLYVLLHTRARMINGWQSFLKHKKVFSLEIISSKDEGIRFLLGVPKKKWI